ncbi:MAG: hypothetical protein JWO31_886 [Phycisphaerales bacterium]|nr:hypothetical protein [Phycisphaerales bacterium]
MPAPVARVKSQFFDRRAVVEAIGRTRAAVLSKVGAFVRQRARSSMRRRKAVAAAGGPPSAHAGNLKDLLFFALDPEAKSVVVGPVPFVKGEAPHLLEFGGTVQRGTPGGRTRTARYHGNPFMAPALQAEAEAGTLTDVWANSLRP